VVVGWILRFLWAWKLRAWLIAADERTAAATAANAATSSEAGAIGVQVHVNNHDSNGETVPLI
jgi:hypothetical protein